MTLLAKNLKDITDKRITEDEIDTINFPAYRSHKLLLKMEEKEIKYKNLQRIRELTLKQKYTHQRRNSELSYNTNKL